MGLTVTDTARVNVTSGVRVHVPDGVTEKAGGKLGVAGSVSAGVQDAEGGSVGVELGVPVGVDRAVGVRSIPGVFDSGGVSAVGEGSIERVGDGERLGVTLEEVGVRLLIVAGVGLAVSVAVVVGSAGFGLPGEGEEHSRHSSS